MINLKKYFKTNEKPADPAVNLNSEKFEINNWIISEFVVEKLYPITGARPFPLNELMLMASAVCRFRPQFVFEWGTHIGKSARIFYETASAFEIDCHVHSIDLGDDTFHVEHPGNQRGYMVKGLDRVTLHQGDGVEVAIRLYKELNPSRRVLFFVDGDHSYESVSRELNLILENVVNPVILLHDTFYQSADANYNTGPYMAIEEAFEGIKETCEKIETRTGLPGMTLIYRR